MLLVAWKRLVCGPAFLFQISNDVQACRDGSLIAPELAQLLDAGQMMAQLPMAHSIRRFAGELIEPAMRFFKRLAERNGRFRAMFCE